MIREFFSRRHNAMSARILDVFKEREYGYEQSGFDISLKTWVGSGSLYPLLFTLEGQGALTSRWDDTKLEARGGHRRRMYSLVRKDVIK
jgi:DNA-binding PadR family transcriptional regulator